MSPGGIESERIFAMRLSFKSFQGKERDHVLLDIVGDKYLEIFLRSTKIALSMKKCKSLDFGEL